MACQLTDRRWTNWFGNQSFVPASLHAPDSEDEARELIAAAAASHVAVRVAGSGHSNVPIVQTDGLLLDLRRLTGIVAVDRERRRVRVRAGTSVRELALALWDEGLSLINQGDTDAQSVAGAVATGTHGSGIELPTFSGALLGARLIGAGGEILEVGERDPALLRAVRMSVGTLGVMTELTLAVTGAYALALETETSPWAELRARWDDLSVAHRHVTLYWCPRAESAEAWDMGPSPGADGVVIKTMDPLPPSTQPTGVKYAGRSVDRAHHVFADAYRPDFHELEYFVPVADGPAALAAVRDLILTQYPRETFPVEIRFVGADDAWLSPAAGRRSCVISICGAMGADNQRFFDDCHRLLVGFGGRGHWGKWHGHTAQELDALYPEIERFRRLRAELDPDGRFLNPHLASLVGASPLPGAQVREGLDVPGKDHIT
jgi:FAD/FMN-containing dehydrogenase